MRRLPLVLVPLFLLPLIGCDRGGGNSPTNSEVHAIGVYEGTPTAEFTAKYQAIEGEAQAKIDALQIPEDGNETNDQINAIQAILEDKQQKLDALYQSDPPTVQVHVNRPAPN